MKILEPLVVVEVLITLAVDESRFERKHAAALFPKDED